MENKSLYRVLRVISLLSKERGYTVKQLASLFDADIKSIYRDLAILKEAGFLLKKDKGYRYFIEKYNASLFTEKLLSFSIEEASMLKDALLATHSKNPLKNQALHKLFALSELDNLVEIIYDNEVGETINTLHKAIKNKKQVLLQNYHSSNSNTIKNRTVEPISFYKNMQYVVAYDTESNEVRQFKPDRAEKAILLNTGQKFADMHHSLAPDVFGMNGTPHFMADLKLNIRAANLLKEEFPASKKHITKASRPNTYIFTAPCKGYEGIGRFALGLPGDVEVLGDEGFLGYLEEKVRKFHYSLDKSKRIEKKTVE
jgi:proteasome accessory factor C